MSRTHLNAEEAAAALCDVEQQLAAHIDGCDQCRAARYGQIAAVWKSCPTGLDLFRLEMTLQHRVNYLALRERRRSVASAYRKGEASA